MRTNHIHTILRSIIVTVVASVCLGYGQYVFNAVDDLRGMSTFPPVVNINHRGDAIILWQDYTKETKSEPRQRYFYVRVVAASGVTTVQKRELTSWRMNRWQDNGRRIGRNSALWITPEKLLVIGWNIDNIGADPVSYRPDKIALDLSGTILTGPDISPVVFGNPDALLLQSSNKQVYAVTADDWSGIHIMQVHPEFGTRRQTSTSSLRDFQAFSTGRQKLLLRDAVAAITSENRLLLCNRAAWGLTPYEERGEWKRFHPDKLFYVFADLNGNFVSEPVVLDLREYAFRKIHGIHLAGIYYASEDIRTTADARAAIEDIDITQLPGGELILSVTAPDERGSLSVYQLRFDAKGKIMKPVEMEVVDARPIRDVGQLVVSKMLYSQSVTDDYVMIGYDENGNFYSERQIWRDGR